MEPVTSLSRYLYTGKYQIGSCTDEPRSIAHMFG